MKGQKGFVTTLLLIVLALAALKYFLNWSIFDAAASEQGQGTIRYIRDVLNTVWGYIGEPVRFIWQEIVIPIMRFAFESLKQLLGEGRAALNNIQ